MSGMVSKGSRMQASEPVRSVEDGGVVQAPRTSQYLGVCRRANQRKFRAEIRLNGRNISLGAFSDDEDAAKACDRAVVIHGLQRPLNFPDDKDLQELIQAKRMGTLGEIGLNDPAGMELAAGGRMKEDPHAQATGSRLQPVAGWGTSPYRGVTWVPQLGKWHAKIYIQRRAVHIGTFTDELSAARAVDAAIIERGLNRPLNFPHEARDSARGAARTSDGLGVDTWTGGAPGSPPRRDGGAWHETSQRSKRRRHAAASSDDMYMDGSDGDASDELGQDMDSGDAYGEDTGHHQRSASWKRILEKNENEMEPEDRRRRSNAEAARRYRARQKEASRGSLRSHGPPGSGQVRASGKGVLTQRQDANLDEMMAAAAAAGHTASPASSGPADCGLHGAADAAGRPPQPKLYYVKPVPCRKTKLIRSGSASSSKSTASVRAAPLAASQARGRREGAAV